MNLICFFKDNKEAFETFYNFAQNINESPEALANKIYQSILASGPLYGHLDENSITSAIKWIRNATNAPESTPKTSINSFLGDTLGLRKPLRKVMSSSLNVAGQTTAAIGGQFFFNTRLKGLVKNNTKSFFKRLTPRFTGASTPSVHHHFELHV